MNNLSYDLLKKHNPFMFVNAMGKSMDFKSWLECYNYTLLEIYKNSRRGYFDAVLFLMDKTSVGMFRAQDVVETWKCLGLDIDYGAVLIDWKVKKESHSTLLKILRCLHMMSETSLNIDMANEALRLLDMSIETLKLEEANDKTGIVEKAPESEMES